jgi:hypothetical protein
MSIAPVAVGQGMQCLKLGGSYSFLQSSYEFAALSIGNERRIDLAALHSRIAQERDDAN